MTVWNPRQIATENVDGQGRSHENRSYPEAPVTMHAPPIWTRTRFAAVAAISFMVVLVSCHFVSIAVEYQRYFRNACEAKHESIPAVVSLQEPGE